VGLCFLEYWVLSTRYSILGLVCSVNKNIYPHLFRHTRATHLVDKLTEAQMKIYFGWSGRSEVPSVYVHLSGRDVEEAILRMYDIYGGVNGGSMLGSPEGYKFPRTSSEFG
jgi:integrase